jgi:transcriptional regulator with XRE-family HTH domain
MSRMGETIQKARLAAGLTEKALGKKCGMAESVIKDIESGRRVASDDQAQRILKLLGVQNPVSTELEVAAEPEVKLRPKPRPYVLPVEQPVEEAAPVASAASEEGGSAWLDALGGVVKRVPACDEKGLVLDHVLEPVIGGKIEGGAPDKVFYYRCPDDALAGYRIHAGDLLLTVPEKAPVDEAVMIVEKGGLRVARKIKKLDGGKVLLQTYDREFRAETVDLKSILILGRCIKLSRRI